MYRDYFVPPSIPGSYLGGRLKQQIRTCGTPKAKVPSPCWCLEGMPYSPEKALAGLDLLFLCGGVGFRSQKV